MGLENLANPVGSPIADLGNAKSLDPFPQALIFPPVSRRPRTAMHHRDGLGSELHQGTEAQQHAAEPVRIIAGDQDLHSLAEHGELQLILGQ